MVEGKQALAELWGKVLTVRSRVELVRRACDARKKQARRGESV